MNQAHLITARDFEDGCPVPAEALGRIYRADTEALPSLVAGIPLHTRARLAVFLYGRIHTRELGVRIAGTCEAALLIRIAGALGEAIYDQSRSGLVTSAHDGGRRSTRSGISLAGSRRGKDNHA